MGLIAAGSYTVPVSVVLAALAQSVFTLHWMPVHPVPVPGHTFGELLAPQTPALGQVVPQSSERPQPSPIVPQYWPPLAAVQPLATQFGSKHKLLMPPPPQTPPFAQVPQSRLPPQPSPIVPQYWPPVVAQEVMGTHPVLTQTSDLQNSSAAHEAQFRVPPQPSLNDPQKLSL